MTYTDSDLLELAAKAINKRLYWWQDRSYIRPEMEHMDSWNPLKDDADNRQLQVQLNLALIPCEGGGWDAVSYDSETYEENIVVSGVEPNRAVVTAAAIIGKNKQDLQ